MTPARATRMFFVGILVVTALFNSTLTSLWRPVHAEIDHGSSVAMQGCLTGCMNTSPGIQMAIYHQHSYDEQDRKPIAGGAPRYVQFLRYYEPRKIAPLRAYDVAVLRPPDLVVLSSNYRI